MLVLLIYIFFPFPKRFNIREMYLLLWDLLLSKILKLHHWVYFVLYINLICSFCLRDFNGQIIG